MLTSEGQRQSFAPRSASGRQPHFGRCAVFLKPSAEATFPHLLRLSEEKLVAALPDFTARTLGRKPNNICLSHTSRGTESFRASLAHLSSQEPFAAAAFGPTPALCKQPQSCPLDFARGRAKQGDIHADKTAYPVLLREVAGLLQPCLSSQGPQEGLTGSLLGELLC